MYSSIQSLIAFAVFTASLSNAADLSSAIDVTSVACEGDSCAASYADDDVSFIQVRHQVKEKLHKKTGSMGGLLLCSDTPGWLAVGMPCSDFSPNKGWYSYRCSACSATCLLSYCPYEQDYVNGSMAEGGCATCGTCASTSLQLTAQQKPAILSGSGSSSDSGASFTEDLSPCLQPTVSSPPTVHPPRSRMIVSYNGAGQNLDWLLTIKMPLQIIPQSMACVVHLNGIDYPFKESHENADTLPFINWIISHYDQLPDHTVLLHPGPDDWHRMSNPFFVQRIRKLEPVCLDKLGRNVFGGFGNAHCTCDTSWQECLVGGYLLEDKKTLSNFSDAYYPATVLQKGAEYEALNLLAKLMELKDWNESDPITNWNTHFRNRVCCTESVISKQAIRNRPLGFYKTLRQMIAGRSDLFWGYAWERFMDHIFRCDQI